MRKITLLCLASETTVTLDALRQLGVLHILHVTEPESRELSATRRRLNETRSALDILRRHAAGMSKADRWKHAAPEAVSPGRTEPVARIVENVHTLNRLQKEFRERHAALREERRTIEPYGDFDPQVINLLSSRGIHVRLYQSAAKGHPPSPEGTWIFPISRDSRGGYFAAVNMESEFECDACEFVPHHRPLSVVEEDLRESEDDILRTEQELGKLTAWRNDLEAELRSLEGQETFLDVQAGMGSSGKVTYLQGFCPTDIVPRLRKAAGTHGWGIMDEPPSPDDNVPTLLRNPSWVKPIVSLFDLLRITPGYHEIDISTAFLIFYSIFFALLVGDAGYGLIFLGLTFLLRWKLPRLPRTLTHLLGLLSVCTIVWGALTGTWFSISSLPAPLQSVQIQWLRNDQNLMSLCFLLGAIHLTLAHAWVAVRSWKSLAALSELGWIAITWTTFFAARTLIQSAPFPSFVMWMFLPGLLAVFLFMTPVRALRKQFDKHIMLPLTLIGNFGDLVSYVRLFAVGSATAAISVAFNSMAIGDGVQGPGDVVTALLILLPAHLLNILLCALGVIVHGVRLNTLEFCGHMGVQWKGFEYKPFAQDDGATEKTVA